jgi:hypothetical protein
MPIRIFRNRASNDSAVADTTQNTAQSPPPSKMFLNKAKKYVSSKSLMSSMSGKYNGLVTSLKEELQCVICMEEFTEPRVLNCGHRYLIFNY